MATFRPDEEDSVYIGHGTEIRGAIRARDTIVIDGAVDGEIVCGHLILGQNGVLKGKVSVSTAEISGQLTAEIVAKNLLSVSSTGRVEGTWSCGTIEVERGAVLNGSAGVTDTAAPQRRVAETRAEALEGEVLSEDAAPAVLPLPAAPLSGGRRVPQLTLRAARRSLG
ncbi:MAG: hypothetical protein CTY15_11265 [Methylocystis sp.]|nr:MAG: hypothetical protein CTY15_11265 [Methylocystis sp.]